MLRRPGALLALLFLLSFAIGLLPQLPLRFVLPVLPRALACTQPEGSLLAGRCLDLSLRTASATQSLGDVSWTWRPGRLLWCRLAFDVTVSRGPARATALVQRSVGRLELLDVEAQGPMESLLARAAPPGWTGRIEVHGLRMRLQGDQLSALDGEVTARALRSPQGIPWGSYRLNLPPQPGGGLAPGTLESLEGPLQLRGTLQVKADRSWQLDARLAVKPGAPPGAESALALLGPADAAGLRPLSVAGSF